MNQITIKEKKYGSDLFQGIKELVLLQGNEESIAMHLCQEISIITKK